MVTNNQDLDNRSFSSNMVEQAKKADQEDLLFNEDFCKSFAEYVEYAETPISIALKGEFGCGKSSVMLDIKAALCEDKGDKKAQFYGVWINAWQFSLSNNPTQVSVKVLQSIVNQITSLAPDKERKEKITKIIDKIAIASTGFNLLLDIAGGSVFGVNKSTVGAITNFVKETNKKLNDTKNNGQSIDNGSLISQLHDEIESVICDFNFLDNNDDTNVDGVTAAATGSTTANANSVTLQNQRTENISKCNNSTKENNHSSDVKLKYAPCDPFDLPKGFYCLDKILFAVFCLLYNILRLIDYWIYCFIYMVLDAIIQVIKSILNFCADAIMSAYNYGHYIAKKLHGKECKKECLLAKYNTKSNMKGIIIFIDELDRIEPEIALEVLEILNNVFDLKHCVLILSVDDKWLISAIKSKLNKRLYPELADRSLCELYLKKLVHLTVEVPVENYDINPLLKKLFKKNRFFNEDELQIEFGKNHKKLLDLLSDVVKLSVGRNPRSVKQLTNYIALLDSLSRTLWKRIGKNIENPGQMPTLIKVICFIMHCIKEPFPHIFNAIMLCPYFKSWNDNIIKAFRTNQVITKLAVVQAIDEIDVSTWEFVLFSLCILDHAYRCNQKPQDVDINEVRYDFERARGIINIIELFVEEFVEEKVVISRKQLQQKNEQAKTEKDIYNDIIAEWVMPFFYRKTRYVFKNLKEEILNEFNEYYK